MNLLMYDMSVVAMLRRMVTKTIKGDNTMSILSWLKNVTSGGNSAELMQGQQLQFAKGEEEFHGLDMKAALDAHMAWVHRVESKLSGANGEAVDIAEVAADHNCTLGKWIHGTGRQQFSGTPEYDELRKVHAAFHLMVGQVINDVQNGENEKARDGLKKIRHESGAVQLALIRLYSVAVN